MDLSRLFAPRAVALVGAPGDPERPGARPLRYLKRHRYPGRIHLVNPRHREIDGQPAYPTLTAVPGPVDVAWIGLPAEQAVDAVGECGRLGVPFAVVLGAGFAESGEAGAVLQDRLRAAARATGVRLVGPNTIGFVNAWDRVALSFSTVGELDTLLPGPVALLSQSGGVGGCLLNDAVDRNLGVGLFVSTGNEADLGLADYVEWLADDGRARAIACLVEQVRDPERFARAVRRAVDGGVPVVALKLGGSQTGARAARSHTGSLVGARDAWHAWARAVGLLEVAELEQLMDTAAYLALTPPLAGSHAAMVTSSGGVAVMLADALEPRGFTFGPFADETAGRITGLLPAYASARNPLDITAGLPDEIFGEVLAAVLRDPGVDVAVVPLTMATADGGRARAARVAAAGRGSGKPLAVCWPGGSLVAAGVRMLGEARVPIFHSVAGCAAALGASLDLRSLREAAAWTPAPAAGRERWDPTVGGVLSWPATRRLLEEVGLVLPPEVVVRDEAAAWAAVGSLTYPVAVKLLGPLHKTDADGVRLDLGTAAEVLAAVTTLLPRGEGCLIQPMVAGVEVLVGALSDPALGPFVVVAPGGIHAELYGERAMHPAPVSVVEAETLVGECRALGALLRGYRGRPPAARWALAEAIHRVSVLAADLGTRLLELDLNPVIVGPDGATVVDARVVLADP